ncbi:hypothetical protein EST38_g9676 [Candolleomyces aberdarensis]|uniref:Uncharacterized protein n=1 Tax=Candolleomyces aberdarensis TaxID=2316362 RepID=A0A4Q2DB11_9AGAR|nr:hypothetical protein EST38_g9676 [Candolleomyces aberdarensis]
MQPYAIDEHYDEADAVTQLQTISLQCIEETKNRGDVHQLANMKWDSIQVGEFQRPKTWRMCQFNTGEGGMEEVQFRIQGIIYGKDLPPVSGNIAQLKRARRYIRQNVKLYGGQSDVFADAARAIEKAYITFAGQFPDGFLEPWGPGIRGGNPVVEANTRYLTPKLLCGEDGAETLDEYVDPNGTLKQLMEDEFVYGPDNKVDYMEKLTVEEGKRYRKISPTQFKVGDIVEAVLTFVCYPTQKGTAKMAIGIKALAMLDHTNRDKAAILRMREKHKAQTMGIASATLKRKSAYGNEDTEDATARLSRMRIDEEANEQSD